MSNPTLKVFILEDLSTDIELIKRQCFKYSAQSTFTVARNKANFYERINWLQPDIVLSDYNLPDFNGLAALLYVKQKLPDVPFVFVTGTLNDDEKVARAILEGADGFIIKQNLKNLPALMDEVITTSRARIEKAKKEAEEARQRKMLLEKLEAKIIQLETKSNKEEALQLVKRLQVVKQP